MLDFFNHDEKKVEYIELIYDLIFVYIIGRNNSLVSHITDGFISFETFLTYFLCTLITIQIWYSTTLFINRYGSNSFSEYIGLFINMYLLYYIAEGTRIHWENYYYRYNIAWMLIMLNIAFQYYLKYRKIHSTEPWKCVNIRQYILTLIIQAAIIAAGIGVFALTGFPAAPAAMVFGIIMAIISRKKSDLVALDFSHLTERVMLYIVFTFGEMIIAIASYFSGEITPGNVYYSTMAFFIVVCLFMSYGFMYDRLLDRDMNISGNTYMIIHIFIILALSNLTNALEFMRESHISLLPKSIYLAASFAVYYIFLLMTAPFTKGYRTGKGNLWRMSLSIGISLGLMMVFYKNSVISIAVSAAMAFSVLLLEYRYWKDSVQPYEKHQSF